MKLFYLYKADNFGQKYPSGGSVAAQFHVRSAYFFNLSGLGGLRPHNSDMRPRSNLSAVRRFVTAVATWFCGPHFYFCGRTILVRSALLRDLKLENLHILWTLFLAQVLRLHNSCAVRTLWAYGSAFYCLWCRLLLFELDFISGVHLPIFLQFSTFHQFRKHNSILLD